MPGLIAIVGRPNVGKSALFNRIIGKRVAIVHDQPGVTRDRISVEAEWRGYPFTLADTGGIGLLRGEKSNDIILQAAVQQVELAIEAAQVIIFVVNVRDGVTPLDREVADRLRRSRKPVVVAVNKIDHEGFDANLPEFSALGFEKLVAVSAIHGIGIEQLVDAAFAWLPAESAEDQTDNSEAPDRANAELPTDGRHLGPMKLAVVGRPNVGKSSLINALARSERLIVSPIPGTTRDAVDVPIQIETDGVRQEYVLIDTAGVRQERRIDDSVEFFSVKRTDESIARCDIAILVIDAESGVSAQDKKVAGKILDERKACIIVVNKWDLVADSVLKARQETIAKREARETRLEGNREPLSTLGEFATWVQEQLFFLDYAPVIFASAKSGFHLERLLEAIRFVAAQLQQKVPTALLNRALYDAIEERQPVSSAGHRLKFFYATQVRQSPPTFLLFVNRAQLLTEQYTKYLASRLRMAFGYEGCPLVLVPKARPKSIEPKRKPRPTASRETRGAPDAPRRDRRSPDTQRRHRRAR